MRGLRDALERVDVDHEAVVLRRDLDPAGGQVLHRLVQAAMAELELVGACAPSASAEQLMAEADAEDRASCRAGPDRVDRVADGGRIARTVREEDAVRDRARGSRSALVLAGTTVTRQPASTRQRRMLRLAPKSIATT